MSLKILGPRPYFWQWDTGQKLVVGNRECGEVHFDNGTTDHALVVQIKTDPDGNRVADVPNILLQAAKPLKCYLFQETESGAMTSTLYTFQVLPRAKPEDYVYTETEVLRYAELADRLDLLNAEVEDLRKDLEDIEVGTGGRITINGEGPDEHGNFIINALNDVEIAQLDATLIGGTK